MVLSPQSMAQVPKNEDSNTTTTILNRPENAVRTAVAKTPKFKSRSRDKDSASAKRRCCDGNTPSCAACSSVYGTECIYDPNSDHRRKGVYKKDIDNLKTRNSTLQTLIHAILNYPEDEVLELVRRIRTCESLDDVAETILTRDNSLGDDDDEVESPLYGNGSSSVVPTFETELSGKMGELRLDNGSVRFIGGTSNLIFLGPGSDEEETEPQADNAEQYEQQENPIASWTTVTSDPELIVHLMNLYFTWHYTYFTALSKHLFYHDFLLGKPLHETRRKTEYCTPLLVNAMLALGCHFTSWQSARADPRDSATAGDHFFKEAKRLILENDEYEKPRLATVQALALMSVREAGCGREAKGWVYSGMSFRMACDLGLNVDSGGLTAYGDSNLNEEEVDARRITIWGCFLFDKCWSNYLGRQPQLPLSTITAPRYDVFPTEDADIWSPYNDAGMGQAHSQPSRTRAVALQISYLCEISGDLLSYFYHPTQMDKPVGKQAELKKLSELHTRLEAWRKNLPKEMEAKEGQLPSVLVMHMFFQLLFIHLFRPFLKYNQVTSPLPAHVSPRKLCTHAAAMISKLLRLYKRTHGLRQICNIAVYIAHSACTIHLLNLPEKNAKRDITHGVKHLEEIAESWLCARRTLGILSVLAKRWKIEVPEEAASVLARTDAKFGLYHSNDQYSPSPELMSPQQPSQMPLPSHTPGQNNIIDSAANDGGFYGAFAPNGHASASSAQQSHVVPSSPSRATDGDQRLSRQHRFDITPAQEEAWNRDLASRGSAASAQMSPSTVFGGIDSLVRESEGWWVKDQSALARGFGNWGGLESDMSLSNGAALPTGYVGSGDNPYNADMYV